MLKESKDMTEYFCETHPKEKVSFYCYEYKIFVCNTCLAQKYKNIEKLKQFCPNKFENSI